MVGQSNLILELSVLTAAGRGIFQHRALIQKKKKKRSKNPKNTSVFVEGLPKNTPYNDCEQALRLLFKDLGKISKIKVYRSELNHYESNGSALVTFAGPLAAAKAVGEDFQGKEVRAGFPVKITKADFGHKSPLGGVIPVALPVQTAALAAAQLAASLKVPETAALSPIPVSSRKNTASAPTPAPALAAKSVSNAVLIYEVFDPMKETSREEKEFENKCRAFAGLTDFHVTMNGSVVAQFENKQTANKCADQLHATRFHGTLLVCDFVASKEDTKPVLSREVMLGNVITPIQAVDDKFVEQLEVDFRCECSKYGPVTDIETLGSQGVLMVSFKSGLCAADCIKAMNGRMFDGKRMTAKAGDV